MQTVSATNEVGYTKIDSADALAHPRAAAKLVVGNSKRLELPRDYLDDRDPTGYMAS
jgi:hypothetical protein